MVRSGGHESVHVSDHTGLLTALSFNGALPAPLSFEVDSH